MEEVLLYPVKRLRGKNTSLYAHERDHTRFILHLIRPRGLYIGGYT